MILKPINFMKTPLNFLVIDRYSVDAKFTKQPPQSTNFTKIPRTFCSSIFKNKTELEGIFLRCNAAQCSSEAETHLITDKISEEPAPASISSMGLS